MNRRDFIKASIAASGGVVAVKTAIAKEIEAKRSGIDNIAAFSKKDGVRALKPNDAFYMDGDDEIYAHTGKTWQRIDSGNN